MKLIKAKGVKSIPSTWMNLCNGIWLIKWNEAKHELMGIDWTEHQAAHAARQAHSATLLFVGPLCALKKEDNCWNGRGGPEAKDRATNSFHSFQSNSKRWMNLMGWMVSLLSLIHFFQLSSFNLQWKLKKFSFLWVEWERLLKEYYNSTL